MVCVDSDTKDELHIVEVEGQDTEGQKVKAVLASLKPSTLPSVCLGGFAITPPAVFRLKAGSGPVHISGQHLVMMGGDQSFDEEEEEEALRASKKRLSSAPALKSPKKMKMDDEDDDEDDDDDDDDDDDEEDGEDESEVEESPVKPQKTPSKPNTSQNGKSPKPKTLAATPTKQTAEKNGKATKPQTPRTPQTPSAPQTVDELKARILESVKKGTTLPKLQPKFENFVKHGMKVTDGKVLAELWRWRQTVSDTK